MSNPHVTRNLRSELPSESKELETPEENPSLDPESSGNCMEIYEDLDSGSEGTIHNPI